MLWLTVGALSGGSVGCGGGHASGADASGTGGGAGSEGGTTDTGGVAGITGTGGTTSATETGGIAGASGTGGQGGTGTAGTTGAAGTSGGGGASGAGGQLAPQCTQTIIDLPGTALPPPTLVPTNDGIAVVWMNMTGRTLQGGRIVGGAFTSNWMSTFMVSSTTVPATWNGTDLALTYITPDADKPVVNLITVAADGSVTSGPFPLPGNSGLPVAVAWNGSEYGLAWSDLTTVTFLRVGTDGGIRDSKVLDGFRSPPSVQWDGAAWLVASAMIWTINEPARLDVTRLDTTLTSLGKQSTPTTGALRAAQVIEVGNTIFAAFGNSNEVRFARFDRGLTSAPVAAPLTAPPQMGAIGIGSRGATLGIAMITQPTTLGLSTYFLEVDQNGHLVRTTQLLGSNTVGNLGSPPVSVVPTATGWAIAWTDWTNSYWGAKVSLLDCP